jgi:predicted nucleic acid-binding protein
MSPSNPKYFVDTNILIYAHDRAAGPKHERARQLIEHLWTTGQGALSTQVLHELCVNLRRRIKHRLPSEEIKKLIEDYLSWEIVRSTLHNRSSRPSASKRGTRSRTGTP